MQPRISTQDIAKAAATAGVEPAALTAVTRVETGGKGGFLPDGKVRILFERHYLYRRLVARNIDPEPLRAVHPDLCYPYYVRTFPYGGEAYQWVRVQTVTDWAVKHGQKADSYRKAAYESCSWGLFQLMGNNFAECGFANVDQFAAAMSESEARQLEVAVAWMKSQGLLTHLRNRDFVAFARGYNGSGNVADYSDKLASAYRKAKAA